MPRPEQTLFGSLRTDPKLDHPRQGAAARSERRVRVTNRIQEAEAEILGVERIVSAIARKHGVDAALKAASERGWNADYR